MRRLSRCRRYSGKEFPSKGLGLALGLLLALWTGVPGQAETVSDPDVLMHLSLEELMNIEVFSVARKEQKLFSSAAAISVITQEEIRRSGLTSLPELLRLVPGLQIGRVDANKWALTARGFNGRFANKLQVLIDGRSLYTPLFAGVFWREQDLVLEDIEHIEVIRGPGATLWGANAVNGIINIITKEAAETQGVLASVGFGSEELGFGSARYGGSWGDDGHYRIFAKFTERDPFVDAAGVEMADGWRSERAGFQLNWAPGRRNTLMLQGQMYGGEAGQTYEVIRSVKPPFIENFDEDSKFAGGHLMARWERTNRSGSQAALQIYYDRHELDDSVMSETRHTADVDFQYELAIGGAQEVVWGVEYWYSRDDITVAFPFDVTPKKRGVQMASAFVQDDIALVPDHLRLTLGSKFEHGEYTGFEIQPNARLLWQIGDRQTLWGAVARAVRTPSRAEVDGKFPSQVLPSTSSAPNALDGIFSLFGSEDMKSELLLAMEIGYRLQPAEFLSFDLTAFHNRYDRLLSVELGTPTVESIPVPYLSIPIMAGNKRKGDTYGLELEVESQVREGWRLHGTYTFLEMRLDLDKDSRDTTGDAAEGEVPQHQLSLGSALDLPHDIELDCQFRYVDELPNLGVDSYVSFDARLGWQPIEEVRLSLVGQNLLDSHRIEYSPEFVDTLPTETQRGLYGRITWSFGR
jgi:iron complex outermembrane recepter protein